MQGLIPLVRGALNRIVAPMRIFVTGATGVVGRRAVPLLLAAGHGVTAAGRSRERLTELADAGAQAAVVNLFDGDGLRRALAGHDAVVNLATHIPPTNLRAFLPGAWTENDRIRSQASALLVDAARANGIARFVQESFAPMVPDRGNLWIWEDTPPEPTRYNKSALDAEANAQRAEIGVVLRFGYLYGAGDGFTDNVLRGVRRGWLALFGRPEAFFSMVNHDDAAAAVLAALALPAGIYNVVDQGPMTRRDLGAMLAELLEVRPPRMLPRTLTLLAGSMGELLGRSCRISSRKLRTASSWAPKYDARRGWGEALRALAVAESATHDTITGGGIRARRRARLHGHRPLRNPPTPRSRRHGRGL